jgi:hypothetical protein
MIRGFRGRSFPFSIPCPHEEQSKGVGYLEYSAVEFVLYSILQVIDTLELRGAWNLGEVVIVLQARMFSEIPGVNVTSGSLGDFSPLLTA